MNSRRKFIRNSSLAASVLLAAKPVKLMAEAVSPFSGNDIKSIVLFHTAGSLQMLSKNAGAASEIKRSAGNALLLHAAASTAIAEEKLQLLRETGYDGIPDSSNDQDNIHIIQKGQLKIGVIHNNVSGIAEVNRLAKNLKQQHNCNMVVCLSSLGFKNADQKDDIRLAENSAYVDVILSGKNAEAIPTTIALNSRGEEVIIDHAGDAIGCMEIKFNRDGVKNHIAFGMQQREEVMM